MQTISVLALSFDRSNLSKYATYKVPNSMINYSNYIELVTCHLNWSSYPPEMRDDQNPWLGMMNSMKWKFASKESSPIGRASLH
jgi:hypothetical protein